MRRRSALALLLVPLALAACEHARPGGILAPADVGPFSATLPRRLTFNVGNDRTPSVAGSVVAYARQGDAYPNLMYSFTGREECVAILPLEGGTIRRLFCPHVLVPLDTFVNTWFEPVLSPDGARVAFVWQRGPDVGPLGIQDAYLMVTPLERPWDTTQVRLQVNYHEAGATGRWANVATHITWSTPGELLFLATFEYIFKVKGGGAERVTDTTYEPLALQRADLPAGVIRDVPGGDSVIAYAPAPDGALWVVRAGDASLLQRLDPATGVRTPVGRFSDAVVDLANVDGKPAAVVAVPPITPSGPAPAPGRPGTVAAAALAEGGAIERLDPATGTLASITGFGGPVHNLVAAGGRRVVVEVEQGRVAFGAPTDLWLLEIPDFPPQALAPRVAR